MPNIPTKIDGTSAGLRTQLFPFLLLCCGGSRPDFSMLPQILYVLGVICQKYNSWTWQDGLCITAAYATLNGSVFIYLLLSISL